MHWKVLTFMACLYGFLKEYRPSEAYLSAYLTGPWKNLTVEEVNNEVYPFWTYSYLVWLVPVFLLTDYLRYMPMLVVGGLAYVGTWALLLWAQGVLAMKFMQVIYGLATATEIGYFSYLFAMISNEHYKIITSFTRAAILVGRFVAYLTGQLLVSFDLMNYQQLNIISFVSVSLALFLALTFRRSNHSDIFHSREKQIETINEMHSNNKIELATIQENPNNWKSSIQSDVSQESSHDRRIKSHHGLLFLWQEIKTAYSDKSVIVWSCWWTFASYGNLQVGNYIQNLWEVITPEDNKGTIYNGAVEAFGTLISALSVVTLGFLPVNWSRRGLSETIMAAVCIFNTAAVIVLAKSTNIWASYALYSAFRATYHTVISLATLQIAKSLTKQRYGFVFGVNMFMALVVETILTVIVVDKAGLDVDVRTQFLVYGGYFGFLSLVFSAAAFYTVYKNGCSYRFPVEETYYVST